MSSSSFLVAFLGYSVYIFCHLQTVMVLLLLLQFEFLLFFSLIAAAKTMLNKSDESGHPCFVPDLRGNAFSFSLFSMMLALGLSYMAFIMLKYIPSVPTF